MDDKEPTQPADKRNRGPHPRDKEEFAPSYQPSLRNAAIDFSMLLSLGYAEVASLKLVGDHFRLSARQRMAVRRSSCTDTQRKLRSEKRQPPSRLKGEVVQLDGFNIIVTIESALSGAVLLKGQDEVIRDLGSVHGTYKHVAQTEKALDLLADWFGKTKVQKLEIYLDQPVSNSGRLAVRIRDFAEKENLNWEVQTVPNPDKILTTSQQIVATADAWILDECKRWTNIVGEILEKKTDLWLIEMGRCDSSS